MIFTHQFENGLTLVGEPNPAKSVAAFSFLLPAGSATEPHGKEGISGVLENLLFCGAGDKNARELGDALDGLGLARSSGAEIEATTLGAATLGVYLEAALRLYADILRRPVFPESDFESQKSLALQALRALDDAPARKLMVRLRENWFTSRHRRSALGTLESLENLTLEDVRLDHQSRFAPGGAILAVAGDFEWQHVVALVGELFGDWQGKAPPLEAPQIVTEPLREHHHDAKEQVQIGINFRGAAPDERENYAFRLATQILGGGMGARLFSEVREKRGLVYSVSASAGSHRGIGWTTAYAGTTAARAGETLEVLERELAKMQDGVSEEELDRARTKMLTSLVMSEESTRSRAATLARDWWILGRVRILEELEREVWAVTPREVAAFYEKYPPRDFSVVTVGPTPIF